MQELIPYFNKDVNGLDHEFARQMFIDQKAAIFTPRPQKCGW